MARKPRPVRHCGGWRIRWIDPTGRRRSETFATEADAEFALSKHLLEVEEVDRRLRGLSVPNKTFGDVCDYWSKYRLPKKRSATEDRSMIDKHLRPSFGQLLLRQIGEEQIDQYMAERAHLSLKTVNNQLTLLVSLLRQAKRLKWVTEIPEVRKPKVISSDEPFRYLRTKDEIRRFLISAQDEGEQVFTLYSLAVYTGLREGEIAGLDRSDIDLNRRQILVRRSYEGPTKSGRTRIVPILDALLPTLRAWILKHGPGPLFLNEAGNRYRKSARMFQEVFHRVLKRADFPEAERNAKIRRYIVFHDLRHTFASHWMMDGGDIFKLQRILGHQSIAMTQRYSHLSPNAFIEDYGRLQSCNPLRQAPTNSLAMEPFEMTAPIRP